MNQFTERELFWMFASIGALFLMMLIIFVWVIGQICYWKGRLDELRGPQPPQKPPFQKPVWLDAKTLIK